MLSVPLGLLLATCSDISNKPRQSVPAPTEVVDLGALVTETTPEHFWGRGLLAEMGYSEPNSFEVIQWEFGPVSGSSSYYRLFSHGGPHIDAPNHVGLGEGLDSFPVESFAGPLKVLDFSHLPTGRTITLEMLMQAPIAEGDVVLIYTGYPLPAPAEGMPEALTLGYDAAKHLAWRPFRYVRSGRTHSTSRA